jgi:hypothetical protein
MLMAEFPQIRPKYGRAEIYCGKNNNTAKFWRRVNNFHAQKLVSIEANKDHQKSPRDLWERQEFSFP